jgi:hypothetical protein
MKRPSAGLDKRKRADPNDWSGPRVVLKTKGYRIRISLFFAEDS